MTIMFFFHFQDFPPCLVVIAHLLAGQTLCVVFAIRTGRSPNEVSGFLYQFIRGRRTLPQCSQMIAAFFTLLSVNHLD